MHTHERKREQKKPNLERENQSNIERRNDYREKKRLKREGVIKVM